MNLSVVNSYIITREEIVDISLVPFPFYAVRKGHDSVIDQVNLTGNEYKLSLEKQPNSVNKLNVTTFPTVIYTTPKGNDQEVLLRLEGFDITETNTAKALLFLGNLTVDGSGNYQSDGKDWSPIYGFDLFDSGIKSFIWGAFSIWMGMKAFDAPTATGQIGYGSLAAFSASKAFNLKSK